MKQSIKFIGKDGREGQCLTVHFSDDDFIFAAEVDFGENMSEAVFGSEGEFIITDEK